MNLGEIDLRKVYRIWKSDLGPFQGFFRSTPFVSLQTYDDFELNEESASIYNEKKLDKKIINEYYEEILSIILENSKENNFLIIDFPLSVILDLALVLNNKYSIKPILNVNLLFHPFGIIGNRDEINKLINNGLKLKKLNTNKFVMLIPCDRYDNKLEANKLKDKLNNQYEIGEDDLPYVNMLKELEYSNITILIKDSIKEDLNEYINFINKEIKVEIIKVM